MFLNWRGAALLVLTVLGCAPPCGRVCSKVLDCGLDSERVSYDECQAACEQQHALYDEWGNDELLALFDDHKRCVSGSSCEELAQGVCYEGYEDLWAF